MKAILLTIKIALVIIQGKRNAIISVTKTFDIKKRGFSIFNGTLGIRNIV